MSQADRVNDFHISARVRWYVRVRWFFLLSLGLSGLIPEFVTSHPDALKDTIILFLGLGYNGIFWLLTRVQNKSEKYYRWLGYAQIISDILLISYLLFTKGGIESRTIIAYAIPILGSMAIFGRKTSYITALACALVYDLMLLGDWFKILVPLNIQFPSWHNDGAYLVTSIMFYSATLLIISLIADFIDRLLQTEQAKLRKEQTNLKEAQAIAHIGNWEWMIDDNVLTCSDEIFRIYGMKEQEEVPTLELFLSSVHPDDRPQVESTIQSSVKTGQPFEMEYRIVRKGGSERTVRTQGEASLNALGGVTRLVGIVSDVTGTKAIENEVRKRSEDLEKFNQLMVGRELKMVELKERIKELEKQVNK